MNKYIKAIMLLFAFLYGGFVSRWHGGGFFSFSKAIKNIAWSLPLALVSLWGFHSLGYDWYWSAAAFVVSMALCFLGKTTGHGQWFLYGMIIAITPEKLDFIVRMIFGKDPRTFNKYSEWRDDKWKNAPEEIAGEIAQDIAEYGENRLYWRNFTGLALVGFTAVSGLFVSLLFVNVYAALTVLMGGLMKAPSYAVGEILLSYDGDNDGDFDEPTEIGEALTGVFAYLAAGIAVIII